MEINTESLKKFFTKTSLSAIRNSMHNFIDLDYYKNFVKDDASLEKTRKSMMNFLDKDSFKDN